MEILAITNQGVSQPQQTAMTELTTDFKSHPGEVLYLAEEAQQILSLAIAREVESGELSRQQLLEIAEELGISAQTLAIAEAEWQLQKQDSSDKQVFDRQRRQRFHHGLARFLVVGGFLIAFDWLMGGSLTWLLYLGLGPWALQLTWRAWCIYRPNEYVYSQDFERWRRRQQMGRAVKGAVRRLLSP